MLDSLLNDILCWRKPCVHFDDCLWRSIHHERVESTPKELFWPVPQAGVRRERTEQFAKMRDLSQRPRCQCRLVEDTCSSNLDYTPDEDSSALSMCRAEHYSVRGTELLRIFDEASATHTCLASKLAQHNGLRQFGVEFANRVPPLELRMLLPELQASIRECLLRLEQLTSRLTTIEVSSQRDAAVYEALKQYIQRALSQNRTEFEEQHQHLQKMANDSPLYSPVLSPVLTQRLSATVGSPSVSTTVSILSEQTDTSPMASPRFISGDLIETTVPEMTLPPAEDTWCI